MKKKFLAMLLCLSLIFNMLPLSAFADEAVGQAAPVTAKVDFTAQAAGAFLLAPQFDVEVSSDKAEAYGYTDSVSGAVSALDVLVKAHELMLGEAFTAETAKSCLAFNDTDMVSTIFGMETTANGFTLNNNYPKIGNVGSTVQTQSVVTGDKLDFFVYQDTTAWSDQLAWFMQNGEWAKTINGAPKDQVQLKLMGLSYMNAGSYTLDIHLLGTAVSGAQLAWVSNTGALTAIDGAVTATDGTVALTLPETEGTYQLTAYLPSGSNNPLILSLTEVVVGKAPTVADPCALTALSVADFDNWPANSLALTPEFSSDVLAYEASPANYQDLPYAQNAYLKATAASADVTITAEMNGVTQTVTSGSSSWTTLTKGFQPGVYNTLTVTVTDGKDTKVYTVGMPMKDASGNVPAKPEPTPGEGDGDGKTEDTEVAGPMQGKGTAEEPFIVKTQQHLIDMGLSRETLGMYYVLANDITVTNWEHAIGYYDSINHAFTGTLEGNGYTITLPDGVTTGLFSGTRGDYGVANIKNLRVVANNMVAADAYPGILVSNTLSGVSGNITNCAVEGKITVNNASAKYVGGLLGRLSDRAAAVKNSYAAVNIINTVSTAKTGALLGGVQYGTVENCLYDKDLLATGISDYSGTGITGKTTAELKSAADTLNANLPADAIAWKNDSTGYPVFSKHKDIVNGTVTISGELTIGQTLTAEDTYACVDGSNVSGAKTYQWYRVAIDGTETAIDGAAAKTYTVADADSDCKIKVVVSIANAVGGYRSFVTEDAVTAAAEPVDVLVTVVNGGFAKAADGTPMYQKSVTVTDADKDGVLSLNEALLAAHKTYNTEDGFATKNTDFGLQITKLWGEATEIVGICKNDTFTNAVNVEVVAKDDKIVAFIYQDKTTWTDKYTYFTEAEKTAQTGEAVDLTLNILGYASNLPAANVPLGTYSMADGSFTELNVTTDANGKAAVSFAAPGTYYVGPKAEVGGVNYVPAICKVTVKSAIDTTITSQWPNFRGSDNNMAIVSAKTPKSAETAALKWAVKVGGTGMSDYVGAPIIVGDSLIVAYTDTIAKVSMATGEVTATAAMSSSTGLASAIPATYADGLVFRSLNEGVVEAFNAADLSKVWTYRTSAENASRWQGQSPIVYANGKLYVGFGGNSSGDDEFVCLDAKTGKALWTYSHGLYYWAGAVAIGDYIAVGNDSGNLLVFKQTYAEDEEVAPVSSLATGLGKIRCSLAYSSGRVYFTTQGKYLASAAIDSTTGAISDLQSAAIPYASTSTPVVYGDYVYFGYAGHWKNGGYSFAIAKKADLSIVKSVEMPKEVKASALLSTAYEAEGDLYFYISVNDPIGAIKLVKVTPAKLTTDVDNATEVTDLYVPEDDKQQYCISSMICDSDGTIYYRNDASYLFAIKNSSNTGGSGSGSGSGSGGGSGSDPVGNIRVTFSLLGDTKHGDNGKVHTLAGKNLTTWIAATGVTVKADATVYDVMEKVFNSKNYTMTIGEDGYVSAITTPGGVTLAEFDNGADSGWKYTLNGKYPDVGVTEQTLSNGDKIVFHYTDDYTKEDDENISGGGGGAAVDTKYTAADVEDLIDKIGTVTKDSKKAIEKAREAYDSLTAAQKKNVTNYDKLTAAEKAYTELTGEKIDTTKLPFTDVAKGSWYYDAIKAMYDKGLMNGESATKFMPNNKLSRAMLVTILYRMQNEPNVTANALFNDVANGQWYTKAVAWASANNVVNGVGEGKFAPNDSVTRQEMAAMLYRYAKATGMDTTATASLNGFKDSAKVADWATDAMKWAVGSGLMKGNDDNTINPMGTATRAEVATVIVRLLEK